MCILLLNSYTNVINIIIIYTSYGVVASNDVILDIASLTTAANDN